MAGRFGGAHPVAQNDVAKLVVAAGIIFIGLFALLAYGLLSSNDNTQQVVTEVIVDDHASYKMANVLVPVAEVQRGVALEPRMFRVESRPQMEASDRIVRDFSEISGLYSRSIIVPGQPLHKDLLTSMAPVNILTEQIPEGFRGVTIRVDDRTSVEGFIAPGSHVDVVWASTIRGQPSITTIVQNAKVVSLQGQTENTHDNSAARAQAPRTATLLVTAQDAQKIQLASTAGQLSLSLRGDGDDKVGSVGSITMSDLIGGSRESTGPLERHQGTMIMDGKRYLVVNGKLVPAAGD